MQSSSINFSYLIVLYSSRLHISQNKQLWLNEFTHLSSLLWLSAVCTHYYIGCMNILLCIVCIIIHFILLADDLPYVSTIYILYYANGDQCRPIDAKRPRLQYMYMLHTSAFWQDLTSDAGYFVPNIYFYCELWLYYKFYGKLLFHSADSSCQQL